MLSIWPEGRLEGIGWEPTNVNDWDQLRPKGRWGCSSARWIWYFFCHPVHSGWKIGNSYAPIEEILYTETTVVDECITVLTCARQNIHDRRISLCLWVKPLGEWFPEWTPRNWKGTVAASARVVVSIQSLPLSVLLASFVILYRYQFILRYSQFLSK
jgi:hypothetical protein